MIGLSLRFSTCYMTDRPQSISTWGFVTVDRIGETMQRCLSLMLQSSILISSWCRGLGLRFGSSLLFKVAKNRIWSRLSSVLPVAFHPPTS